MPRAQTLFFRHHHRATALLLLGALIFSCSSVLAEEQGPLPSTTFAGFEGSNGCSSDSDSWVVDATNAPTQGDLDSGIRSIRFWRSTGGRFRQEYSLTDFAAAMTPEIPTLFYVHGYGLREKGAIFGATRLSSYLNPCDGKRFRTVAWVWDARTQLLASLKTNIRDKSENAEAQGYYLAHTIRQMSPEAEIALIGHSFGCRSVCACLHGLATNRVGQSLLPSNGLDGPRRLEATLIAAGVENDSLGPTGRYSCALNQVERMLITVNPNDRILRGLALSMHDFKVMGLTGPVMQDWPTEYRCKVSVNNLSSSVWGAHRLGRYTRDPSSRPAILPRILDR